MDEICNDASELLRQEDIPDDVVQRFAEQYNAHLRRLYGGQRQYVPAGEAKNIDRDIFLDWKSGMAIPAIASKHKVTVRTVYRSLNRFRKKRTGQNNGGFGSDEWNL